VDGLSGIAGRTVGGGRPWVGERHTVLIGNL